MSGCRTPRFLSCAAVPGRIGAKQGSIQPARNKAPAEHRCRNIDPVLPGAKMGDDVFRRCRTQQNKGEGIVEQRPDKDLEPCKGIGGGQQQGIKPDLIVLMRRPPRHRIHGSGQADG